MTFRPVTTFAEAQHFLFVDLPGSPREVYRGEVGFARAQDLLNRIGNPQNSFRSIHIAGTSGKGSVAYITAALLQASGQAVGLHVSPHVYDIRERMQINGQFITKRELCRHVNELMPIIDAMSQTKFGRPSYPEVACALALMAFRAHKVDYAVIETGLGGRYDVTNHISRSDKLSIINQIGLDHTAILGNTIEAIASQKAGIITSNSHAIALGQSYKAREQFEVQATKTSSELEYLEPDQATRVLRQAPGMVVFDLSINGWSWNEVCLGLTGKHQATNAALGIRAVQYLSKRDDWDVSERELRKALRELRMPGRFELRHAGGKTIILDGAHNAQKLTSLVDTLKNIYPGQKFCFVVALTDTSKSMECLSRVVPVAEQVIVTWFELKKIKRLRFGIAPQKLARQLERLGFEDYIIEETAEAALERAMKSDSDEVVVTGSFYLVAALEDAGKKQFASL